MNKSMNKLLVSAVIFISASAAHAGFFDQLNKAINQVGALQKNVKNQQAINNGTAVYVCQAGAFGKIVTAQNTDRTAAESEARDKCNKTKQSWVFCTPSCGIK